MYVLTEAGRSFKTGAIALLYTPPPPPLGLGVRLRLEKRGLTLTVTVTLTLGGYENAIAPQNILERKLCHCFGQLLLIY